MNDTQIKKYYINTLTKRLSTFKQMPPDWKSGIDANIYAIILIKDTNISVDMARVIFETQEALNEQAITLYFKKYATLN